MDRLIRGARNRDSSQATAIFPASSRDQTT
jgi:hypothetical protein